jgi:nickel superoxide dismutase
MPGLRGVISRLQPLEVAHAHCDLMCGVYDPAQARIEAESVLRAAIKYQGSDDQTFGQRCVTIKEARAELVVHHLSVLWTDLLKPHHLEAFPDLHEHFGQAIKAAGEAKRSNQPDEARDLIDAIDRIASVFWQTEVSAGAGLYPPAAPAGRADPVASVSDALPLT